MPTKTLRALVIYLLAVAIVGFWTAWTVWIARPEPAPEGAWPEEAAADAGTDGAPVIETILPATLFLDEGANTLRVFGRGFHDSSVVVIDTTRVATWFIAPNQLCALVGPADVGRSRSVAVTVESGTARSLPRRLSITTEEQILVEWRPLPGFPKAWSLTLESRLLLIVVVVGALGGTLASFNSLSSYRGDGKLATSWSLHYFVSPVLGLGVSLLLYAVVRAGFLAGTRMELGPSDTPWGLVAISGLAGLFYDKTMLKLREVFVTLFAPRDTRGGKLEAEETPGALAITTTALEPARRGAPYRARLQVTGGKPPYSWSVSPALPGGLQLDPMTGEISGTPGETHPLTQHTFTVGDMERSAARVTLAVEVRA